MLCCSVAWNISGMLIPPRRETREIHRHAYRRGIAAGYAKCERKWQRRKAVELHDANRRTDARPDAGPAASVSKIRYQSGR
jgi:hypothetical protein